MFHVGIVAALLADPVLFIRRVDCFHFLSQGGESGLAESVIHGDMLCLVTIRAKMELLWHVSCQYGREERQAVQFVVTAGHFGGMIRASSTGSISITPIH
jgi:hypothetical protein